MEARQRNKGSRTPPTPECSLCSAPPHRMSQRQTRSKARTAMAASPLPGCQFDDRFLDSLPSPTVSLPLDPSIQGQTRQSFHSCLPDGLATVSHFLPTATNIPPCRHPWQSGGKTATPVAPGWGSSGVIQAIRQDILYAPSNNATLVPTGRFCPTSFLPRPSASIRDKWNGGQGMRGQRKRYTPMANRSYGFRPSLPLSRRTSSYSTSGPEVEPAGGVFSVSGGMFGIGSCDCLIRLRSLAYVVAAKTTRI